MAIRFLSAESIDGNITVTGDITISTSRPVINLTNTGSNPDWRIENYAGQLAFVDTTSSFNQFIMMVDAGQRINKFEGWLRVNNSTNPTVALDVTGSAIISGNATFAGDVAINGALTSNIACTITGNSGYEDIMYIKAAGTNIDSRINLIPTGTGDGVVNATANDLILQTSGADRVTIADASATFAGNLGVTNGNITTGLGATLGGVRYSGPSGYYSYITRNNGANLWAISLLGTDGDPANDAIGSDVFTINYSGNATFAGTVTATQFIGSGAITGTTASFVSTAAGLTVVSAEGAYAAGSDVKLYEAKRSGGAVGGDWSYNDATTDMEIGTTTNHAFSLKTADTRRLIVNSSGNVLIGGTTDKKTLTVYGGNDDGIWVDSQGAQYTSVAWGNNGTEKANISYDNTNTNFAIAAYASSTITMSTASAERVRITVAGALEIKGAGTTVNGNAFITNTNALTTYGSTQSSGVPKPMAWFTGAERLRMDANGAIYNVSSTGQSFWGSNNAGNPSSVTGVSNSSFGYGAGNALTTGYQNVNIGRDSGGALTTGLNNVNVGTNAGALNVDGQQNTYVGTAAGYTSPGQNYNTFIGYEAGHLNTANENTGVGRSALYNNSTGTKNVALGFNSLGSNTTGNENTGLGYKALGSATGGENTVVGSNSAAGAVVTGSGNTSIGRYNLYPLTSGSYNTAIGHQAGATISTGDSNTVVGKNAGNVISGGSRNSILGQSAGIKITSGADNIAIGYEALYNVTTTGTNVAIGVNSLYNFTGSRVVAMGYNSGTSLTADVDCVFIGDHAGYGRTAGADNTFVGAFSNYTASTGAGNTGVGKATGYSLTSAAQCTFVGRQAGYSCATNGNNTMMGHNAGIFGTGGENTIVGSQAGTKAGFTGNNNTIIGYSAGDEVTSGGQNLVLGFAAGSGSSPFQLTTQAYRIILGDNSSTDAYIKIDWTVTSDKRDKTDFKEIEHGLDFVNKLKPTEYKFRKNRDSEETDGKRRYGFIAQDILKLEGDNSVIIDTEQKDNLKYKQSHLVPVLVKAIQELEARVKKLEKNK